jgi:hypothetical protein
MKLRTYTVQYLTEICRSSRSMRYSVRIALFVAFVLFGLIATTGADEGDVLVVPECSFPLRVAVDLPPGASDETSGLQLVESDGGTAVVPVQLVPRVSADGTVAEPRGRLAAVIPPKTKSDSERRFKLERIGKPDEAASSPFELATVDDRSLKITEGDKPVLAYNYGTIVGENVPEKDHRRERACYIHPVWGLDGEVITDDFPRDHFHHHGIFWAWPHVGVGGKQYDSWVYGNIKQRFVRWLHQQAGPVAAVLGVENGWFVGERQVMTERVWVCVYRCGDGERSIDIDMFFVPNEETTLQGAGGKSYGGLTMRFAVRNRGDVKITVPDGPTSGDLKETPLAWADLTAAFEGAPNRSGGAVFVHPAHPDYPPTWLTRHYGPLCVGWPGVKARTFEPGKPFRLPYRLWLHRGAGEHEALKARYDAYTASTKVAWSSPPPNKKAD